MAVFCFGISALLLVPSLALALQSGADSWEFETISALPQGCRFLNSAVALDEGAAPHISYVQDGMLIYASRSGVLWKAEVVESLAEPLSAYRATWVSSIPATAIAVSDDVVHMAYTFPGSGDPLRYAKRIAGLWSIEGVDERSSSSTATLSLALANDGTPVISYCGYPSSAGCACSLKLASRVEGQWSTELVKASGSGRTTSGRQSVLRLAGGVPCVATTANGGPAYSTKRHNWSVEMVAGSGEGAAALALDSDGRPWVVWLEKGTVQLAHRHRSGEWYVEAYSELIDPEFHSVAIEVDSEDDVHVVFGTREALRYGIRRHDGEWEAETIDENGLGIVPFFQVSLALDMQGRPHVTYVRSDELSRMTLLYAFRP